MMMMLLIERSECDDDVVLIKISECDDGVMYCSKVQSMMMMLLIERSEYDDDVADVVDQRIRI